MALDVSDIDPRFIATAASVLISGTHLSQPGTYAACRGAIEAARAAGGRVVLDIDFRPVLWGLTPLADGETRYVQAPSASATLQAIIAMCDLIVGTEEEFCIAADTSDPQSAVSMLRGKSAATLVLKRGASGCTIFPGLRGAAAIEVADFDRGPQRWRGRCCMAT
jgi:5-dehydro-2-deoxygluconokinase